MDEGIRAVKPRTAKKLKKKPSPHYLVSTTASKAMNMKRPKSPFLKAGAGGRNMTAKGATAGGPQGVPMSLTKRIPTSPLAKTAAPPSPVSPFGRATSNQWIEDLPVSEMKLYFENYK